jgi:hypothetical protein
MSPKFIKFTTLLQAVLMGLAIVFVILLFAGGVVRGTEGTRYEEPRATNSFIIYAYILLAITLLITLFFTIRNAVINPKGISKSLIVFGIVAVLIGIAALMADNTVLDLPHYRGKDNNQRTLFWTDTGLIVAYFMLGIAFLSIIYSIVARYFKK